MYMSRKDCVLFLSIHTGPKPEPDPMQLFNTCLKNGWGNIKPYLKDIPKLLFLSLTVKRDILCQTTTKCLTLANVFFLFFLKKYLLYKGSHSLTTGLSP